MLQSRSSDYRNSSVSSTLLVVRPRACNDLSTPESPLIPFTRHSRFFLPFLPFSLRFSRVKIHRSGFPVGTAKQIEDGMLNRQRVERWCRRRFVEVHRHQANRLGGSPTSLQPRRCAHLDKLNYKLDGSLVATRGNVVGAWICMIYTRNPTHRYNSWTPGVGESRISNRSSLTVQSLFDGN